MIKKAKLRSNVAPPATKICVKCKQTKELKQYYANRDWTEQLGKDAWCKDCVTRCGSKDEMREYFWMNNREWNENVWNNAQRKAELSANKNSTYQRANPDIRKKILDRMTCQNVIKAMQINYKFVDHTGDIEATTYTEAKEAGKVIDNSTEVSENADPNIKKYSKEFNGDFKPAELDYLVDFYSGLQKNFKLEDDMSLDDNAKKLAKASLTVDIMQNKYLAGQASIQDLTNAIQAYNSLMSLGNFAASKRKPGEKGGIGSWAELTYQLESTGHPCTRKIEWPKDDVDKTIDEFRYIVQSLGLDGA